MPRAELMHRVRSALRTHSQRARVALTGTRWNRAHIERALCPEVLDAPMRRAIRRRDWAEVELALKARLRGRPSRFVLEPRTAGALKREIVRRWPDAPAEASESADRLAAGQFALLGFSGLSFARGAAGIDWHWDPVHQRTAPRRFWADVKFLDPAYGDHKILWELNRHQHFLMLGRALWLTGDPRYRDVIVSHLQSWLASNPPLVGINWASMLELGMRSLSWLWAMHFLLAAPQARSGPSSDAPRTAETPWLLDMLVALDRQLAHVEEHLSHYFSPNTHLIGEAAALYVTGVALPELAASSRWTRTGRRVLLDEIERQIGPDGGHVERSTHYHRYTFDFYMLALLEAELAGDAEAAAAFHGAVTRLAGFMQAMTGASGRMPLIGDDDGGMLWPIAGRDPRDVRDSLALASALVGQPATGDWMRHEEALWIGWNRRSEGVSTPTADSRPPDVVDSRVFPDTGYVTVRCAADHLVFDVGPHGYLNGGHAHADALSFTLELDGRPCLIDPGTAVYSTDRALRDRMRATRSHNTLTLDGRSSAVPGGPFHWKSRADARLVSWRSNEGFVWAEGCHDGYAPVSHRRSIVHGAGQGWLVVDDVTGGGRHLVQRHWHFGPAWTVTCDGAHRLLAKDPGHVAAWLLHEGGEVTLVRADDGEALGWSSPRYGQLMPSYTAVASRQIWSPATLVAWLGAGDEANPPCLEALPVAADAAALSVAVRIRRRDGAITTLLRPGDIEVRAGRSADSEDYHTNARLLQYVEDESGMVQLSVADGSHALALHEGLLSVGAHDQMHDLHVRISGELVELWSTNPPARLHLQGTQAGAVRTARLNGRVRIVSRADESGALTFSSSDWREADPSPVAPATPGAEPRWRATEPR